MRPKRRSEIDERPDRARSEGGDEKRKKPDENLMTAALKILAARSCSESDLRDRLSTKGWADSSLIDDCISKLKERGYINDDKFAQSYASYRVRTKPLGRARLARELAVKRVPSSSIDEALDRVYAEVTEDTLIDMAIARRLRTHGQPSDRAASKRFFDHLARLGFEYDLITRKLRSLKTKTDKID